MIRHADNKDVKEILAIYGHFIANSMVTFETDIPSINDFQKRIVHHQQNFPWLIAGVNGVVAGYVYASKYRERIAYQWVAEVSIYMHLSYRGKGIAAQLYQALFEILRLQGICKVYAVISVPNPESVGFHEKMGFKWFATYKNVGNKFGKWCDVGWWELELNAPVNNPKPPIPYRDIDPDIVEKIFEKYS